MILHRMHSSSLSETGLCTPASLWQHQRVEQAKGKWNGKEERWRKRSVGSRTSFLFFLLICVFTTSKLFSAHRQTDSAPSCFQPWVLIKWWFLHCDCTLCTFDDTWLLSLELFNTCNSIVFCTFSLLFFSLHMYFLLSLFPAPCAAVTGKFPQVWD